MRGSRRCRAGVVGATLLVVAVGPSMARGRPPEPPLPGADAEAPVQSMRIDVRGAIAHVTVTRTMPCEGERRVLGGLLGTSAADAVLDVALPEGAALLDVAVDDGGKFVPAKLVSATGHEAYTEALRAMGFSATRAVFPDESSFRVRLACSRSNRSRFKAIRYDFSSPLEIVAGVPRLTFPAAADLIAPRTRVQVNMRPGTEVHEISIGGVAHAVQPGPDVTAAETVPVRARWLVTLSPARTRTGDAEAPAAGPARPMVALASSARQPRSPSDAMLAWSIGAGAAVAEPLPERILFLIDRSRSVAPGGLEAERDLARRILDLLPPSTRFDALFFDRGQKRLFPVARPATRAAMGTLEDEMVPARMSNGTDLAGALRAAGELLRREAVEFGPRALLVVLSDGAVGRPATGAPLGSLLGAVPGVDLMIAALSVRANDEPPVSPDERRGLRRLAASAKLGGVERMLRVSEIRDGSTVPGIIETLRRGGDVHAIGIGAGRPNGGQSPALPLVEVLAPGEGANGVVVLPRGMSIAGGLPLGASAAAGGRRSNVRSVRLRPVAVEAGWLAPLARPATPQSRVLVGPAVAAMVEPGPPTRGGDAESDAPRGFMERSVVRDALSLAFTPRARACYLNRSARTAAERDLSGRVRLALDLVRGEVGGVRVESSTLGHPTIESCLREAAYAIEVPRAYRNDEAVTAILNLVFRPRTQDRRSPVLQETTGHELDLLIEAALKDSPDAGTDAGPDASPPHPNPLPASRGEGKQVQ